MPSTPRPPGATSLFLLHDLRKGCAEDKPLIVKLHPVTAKLPDRNRQAEKRQADDLDSITSTARKIMVKELGSRFFEGERPSNVRLIQIWMSKQGRAEKWLPAAWQTTAKALYLASLRKAVIIAGIATRTSPRKAQKTSPNTAASSSLVRNDSDSDDGRQQTRIL